MAVLRITRFTADPGDACKLAERHAALVGALRAAASPGPAEASLARIDERTWATVWTWASAADEEATSQAAPTLPETAAAFSLVQNPTAEHAEIAHQC